MLWLVDMTDWLVWSSGCSTDWSITRGSDDDDIDDADDVDDAEDAYDNVGGEIKVGDEGDCGHDGDGDSCLTRISVELAYAGPSTDGAVGVMR